MDSFENSRKSLFSHVEKLAAEQPSINSYNTIWLVLAVGVFVLLLLAAFFTQAQPEVFSTTIRGDGYVQVNNNMK